MKLLVVTKEERSPSLDPVFRYLAERAEVTLVKVRKTEQGNLKKVLQSYDPGGYDRVFLDLHFKQLRSQPSVVARIPNLVIFEEDACQEFMSRSKRYKAFSQLYRELPRFRLIVTNLRAAEEFGRCGIDVRFVSKGYDNSYLKNLGGRRTIPCAHIGRVNNPVYRERVRMLKALADEFPVEMLRTFSPQEYLEKLNQIRIFVSADVGMDEYMYKNFEAMGCGCLLLAYRQGHEERLGLRDMENFVLYSSSGEAKEKMAFLDSNPQVAEQIARAGQLLAESRFTFEKMAERIFEYLQEDVRENRFFRRRYFRSLLRIN